MRVQVSFLYQEEKNVLITRDWKSTLKCICTKSLKQPSSSTSSVTPNRKTSQHLPTIYCPFPRLLCLVASSVIFFWSKGIKPSCSGHFFRSSFPYEGPPHTCKNLTKLVHLSPVNLSYVNLILKPSQTS